MNATQPENALAELHHLFLVRLGTMGHIGRFVSDTPLDVNRGDSVVCRSARGLERGAILGLTALPEHRPGEHRPGEHRPGEQPLGEQRSIPQQHNAGGNAQSSQLQGRVGAGESLASLYDGRILRRFTAEDHLLWSHLQQLGSHAHEDCIAWLSERQIAATLLDVEPLLDGKTLFFHFLADVPDSVQQHLDQLVRLYERQVRESKFARLLEEGCGPGCGTAKKAGGCGPSGGGCAVCSIAKQCKPAR